MTIKGTFILGVGALCIGIGLSLFIYLTYSPKPIVESVSSLGENYTCKFGNIEFNEGNIRCVNYQLPLILSSLMPLIFIGGLGMSLLVITFLIEDNS